MIYKQSADREMTVELMGAYIKHDIAHEVKRLKMLGDYYVGKHKILSRPATVGKPNNKVVHPYANYITDMMTGYFMGDAVTYSADDTGAKIEDKPVATGIFSRIKRAFAKETDNPDMLLDKLNAIYKYNDEAAENATLASDCSKYGKAVEITYLDGDSNIRFRRIDPIGVIAICDDTIEEELLYIIRHYTTSDIQTGAVTRYAEVYSRDLITKYQDGGNSSWSMIGEPVPHYFGAVPITIYYNNEDELGDYEMVIPLIDAYDKAQSDTVNDYEYFSDAYLVMTGVGDLGEDDESLDKMRNNRVLILPEGSSANWLLKNINDTYAENLKTRIAAEIHKFAKCPALTDQDFAANASGVAMKYKLIGMETAAGKKERQFRKALQRRIELICSILALKGTKYDYTKISMSFKRNLPTNITEIADVLTKIGHLLSEETQIGLLPIDVDYAAERNRRQEEAAAGYSVPLGDDDAGVDAEAEDVISK